MGMYDRIMVYQRCPYCKSFQTFECQTKDLSCDLYEYHPLTEGWEDSNAVIVVRKDFRIDLPVFKQFPLDKEFMAWSSQAELIEAKATLPEEYKDLEFVDVVACCYSLWCYSHARLHDKKTLGYISGFGRSFQGKIKIKDGKLIGNVYDIIFDDHPEYEELKFLETLK